jgi:hypothetical protein
MNPNTRENFQRLIAAVAVLPAIPTAVAHPCDESSLAGAVDAAKLGIIEPILVGLRKRILAAASATKLDVGPLQIRRASCLARACRLPSPAAPIRCRAGSLRAPSRRWSRAVAVNSRGR